MELVVFDLDGTLLNSRSEISAFTRDTLTLLSKNNIAYTLATGRTISSAHDIIAGHGFKLPHIYSNGVITWDPQQRTLSLDNVLSVEEAHYILETTFTQHVAPFMSAVDEHDKHFIFHSPTRNAAEEKLLKAFQSRPHITVLPISNMPNNVQVTNISMIGDGDEVDAIYRSINTQPQLIAYSGPAVEGGGLKWMDIHHRDANKGSALTQLKRQLNAKRLICFGDSDNDLSMFATADESYAPANAKPDIQDAATEVIGYNHEDGVAHFLRQRFNLS